MRLARLELRAFGPFRDVALDLSDPSAIHVVYGPNEAGKSTALRAITGLFYGIGHLSPDAHTHRAEELRIGGRIESAAGASLAFVRRKGRVRTLLDAAGAALPETALLPFLGGIGEEVFRAAFGLNHETLRIGAQALLEGRGHLGESLFGAGLGGTGIARVLEALRREADELFSPLARTKRLNVAIRGVVEARKRAQAAAMPASAWLAQEQSIREAHVERARIDDEGVRLRAEERSLRRARQLVRLFAQLRAARLARASLAGVPLLADDAAAERTLAESEIADAGAQIRRAEETLARLAEQRDALTIPHALLAQADAVDDVSTRLGSHRKAAVDLPRVRAELRTQEEEVAEILRALDVKPEADPGGAAEGGVRAITRLRAEVEPLRVQAARDERIRGLARDAAVLQDRVRNAEQEAAHAASEVAVLRARLASFGPSRARDFAALRRAAARSRALGNVPVTLGRTGRAVADLGRRAEAERAAQGLATLALADVPGLAVPLHETVDAFAAEERTLREEQRALATRLEEARAALERTRAALADASAAGLPTDDELRAARVARTEQARAVRAVLAVDDAAILLLSAANGVSSAERLTPVERRSGAAVVAVAELERRIEVADRLADILRAEAGRVAQRARLAAEVEAGAIALAALERDAAECAAKLDALGLRWREAWTACGVEPRSPEEMRGWLRRHEALVATVGQLLAAKAEHDEIRSRAAEHVADLVAALGDAPIPTRAPGDPTTADVAPPTTAPDPAALPELLDAAEREITFLEDVQREERALASADASLGEASRRLERHRAELEGQAREWEAAIAGLPVRAAATPAEVLRVLDTLGRLFAKLDEARRTVRRVEGMERDARELATRVTALAHAHAGDLEGRPPEVAAVELARRFHQAHADLEKLGVLAQQIQVAHEALAEQRGREGRARARLEALRAAAGADTLEDLARIEGLSADAKRYDRQIELLESQIRDVGENAEEAALLREAEAFGDGVEALSARIDGLEERIADNGRERSQIDRTIGALTEGLAKLREGGNAADAALDLGAAVAEVRSLALTYARSRAATLVLEREIEAYKREHQGPIVERAGELFRALTLGSFAGLATGWSGGDEATLRCVREGGREVDVDGLSDGTRDQLYLALRLATIERFAVHAEPLPLVLDDAFVHFDDARARAALVALADLAPRAQVLFFTHHERLVAIAEDALGARCAVHRLPSAAPAARSISPGFEAESKPGAG